MNIYKDTLNSRERTHGHNYAISLQAFGGKTLGQIQPATSLTAPISQNAWQTASMQWAAPLVDAKPTPFNPSDFLCSRAPRYRKFDMKLRECTYCTLRI